MIRRVAAVAARLPVALGALFGGLAGTTIPAYAEITRPTPIQHVVVIYQENHSFDNVLGKLCVLDHRCAGATKGALPSGKVISLKQSPDVVPFVRHLTRDQIAAINGGKMNGFSKIEGCTSADHHRCYTQYQPSQIPNLAALARHFVISDRTFAMHAIPSWGAHLELVAQTLDGFTGDLPRMTASSPGHAGWGCDSNRDTYWHAKPSDKPILVPSCVPAYGLDSTLFPFGGAYRATPVKHVSTIMDRLDAAHLQWKLYASTASRGTAGSPYGWAICPTFAGCLYTKQHNDQVSSEQVLSDAANGTLPNFSVVLPNNENSQHNDFSMRQGDNWLGSVVSAIQRGPDWPTTAIFITYDDCGCFYDHVPPPKDWGIRMPTVIVSPYARAGYTDSTDATFSSILAFTEHVLGLAPLSNRDRAAYDYVRSFNFNQTPLGATRMTVSPISKATLEHIRTHPADEDDPT
jgi:phospholipase C